MKGPIRFLMTPGTFLKRVDNPRSSRRAKVASSVVCLIGHGNSPYLRPGMLANIPAASN
jgi:hypothetical protein